MAPNFAFFAPSPLTAVNSYSILHPVQEAALRYQICGTRLRRGNVDKIRGP
jgi:hypothetical protein